MQKERSRRSRTTLVNAFNLVPVVEQILPERQKIEVGSKVVQQNNLGAVCCSAC
jgi:hypothetical protein